MGYSLQQWGPPLSKGDLLSRGVLSLTCSQPREDRFRYDVAKIKVIHKIKIFCFTAKFGIRNFY